MEQKVISRQCLPAVNQKLGEAINDVGKSACTASLILGGFAFGFFGFICWLDYGPVLGLVAGMCIGEMVWGGFFFPFFCVFSFAKFCKQTLFVQRVEIKDGIPLAIYTERKRK